MNQKTASLLNTCASVMVDPKDHGVILKRRKRNLLKRQWKNTAWFKRHKMRMELKAILERGRNDNRKQ